MNSKLILLLILLCLTPNPLLARSNPIPIIGRIIRSFYPQHRNPHTGTSPGPNSGSIPSPAPGPGPASSMVDISLLGYVFNFSVGSNHQNVPLLLDITLPFTFMMCQRCENECSTEEQVFIPNESNSFSNKFPNTTCSDTDPCPYDLTLPYLTSVGNLSSDNFYLSDGSPKLVGFGCGYTNTGDYGKSIGVFGLAFGNYSFLYQTNTSKFSYCFNSNTSGASLLFVGSDIQLNTTAGSSTNFITNPNYEDLPYIVNLTGITVGEMYIQIPSTVYTVGNYGMALSTTDNVSYLEESVYNATKAEFMKQMNLSLADGSQYGLDLCYAVSSTNEMPYIPPLTLHFNGADMNGTNYFLQIPDKELYCLMILPNKGISVLGYLMQMGLQMIYDIGNGVLQYGSVDCNNLTGA